jgi:hypothetical protein
MGDAMTAREHRTGPASNNDDYGTQDAVPDPTEQVPRHHHEVGTLEPEKRVRGGDHTDEEAWVEQSIRRDGV